MNNRRSVENPTFQIQQGESTIKIRFSDERSEGVRNRVRDILTGAFEERVQEEAAARAGSK